MQTEKQQLVLRRHQKARLAVKHRRLGPPDCFSNLQIKRQRIHHIVVQFYGRSMPIPLAVIIIGQTGYKAGFIEGRLGTSPIFTVHQNVEVVTRAQLCPAIETLCKRRTLQRDGPNAIFLKSLQHPGQLRGPEKCRYRSFPLQSDEPRRGHLTQTYRLLLDSSHYPREQMFFFRKRQHCFPAHIVQATLDLPSAQQRQQNRRSWTLSQSLASQCSRTVMRSPL